MTEFCNRLSPRTPKKLGKIKQRPPKERKAPATPSSNDFPSRKSRVKAGEGGGGEDGKDSDGEMSSLVVETQVGVEEETLKTIL